MKTIIVPGYQGSPEGHWQFWLNGKLEDSTMVEQDDFENPSKDEWVQRLNDVIEASGEPVQIIAHSMGCITVLKWAEEFDTSKIVSTILVAPADVESSYLPNCIRGFGAVPRNKLPFKTVVVGSQNDPYMTYGRVSELASDWRAHFINVGYAGHINSDSGYGEWEEFLPFLESVNRGSTNDCLIAKYTHCKVA